MPQTFEGFKALLDGPLDEQVLRRAFELLPAQVQLAHTKQQAQWVYNRALQLPGSSTKLFAQQHEGVLINGDFLPNVVSRSALVYAFKNRVPVLLKIPSREGANHEAQVWKALTETRSLPPHLAGPIELLTLKVGPCPHGFYSVLWYGGGLLCTSPATAARRHVKHRGYKWDVARSWLHSPLNIVEPDFSLVP